MPTICQGKLKIRYDKPEQLDQFKLVFNWCFKKMPLYRRKHPTNITSQHRPGPCRPLRKYSGTEMCTLAQK